MTLGGHAPAAEEPRPVPAAAPPAEEAGVSAVPTLPEAAPAAPPTLPEAVPAPYEAVAPSVPRSPFAAPPAPAPAATVPVEAPGKPVRKESVQELVAFGLVAAGAFVGIVSLFLPWAGMTGIGIGTESIAGSPPPPSQWGWGMPAGLPLFLVSLPVLCAAAASDRAQERLPRLASVIGRLTDLILPMILGGLYLGVVFMYMTVPEGYGPGIYMGQLALVAGAGLLIAGAIVTAFFPPEVRTNRPIPDP